MGEMHSGDTFATWYTDNANGTYIAAIYRMHGVRDGKEAWSWQFDFDNEDVHTTTSSKDDHADAIWVPMHQPSDPVRVLGTLASFLAAWEEALKRGSESENFDLFGSECEFMLTVVEEFDNDMINARGE